jgi:hypothetical protein
MAITMKPPDRVKRERGRAGTSPLYIADPNPIGIL